MTHHPSHSGYHALMRRINKFPQGAPPSELLFKIFAILFSEREAQLLSLLPLRPFSARKAAGIWKLPESEARTTLEALASRALLLDLERDGKMIYFLPPPMAGFFEFSLMRYRSDIDQKELGRLLFQYINVEEEFVRDLFAGGATQIGRVLVNESALPDGAAAQVLDYERAGEIIRSASHLAVGICYCRHKMLHAGRGCDAPLDNCMSLNGAAESLIRHQVARQIDAAEGLDILQKARSLNLVQCADNVREQVNFICHCCGCCCEGLTAARRIAIPNALETTNFLPHISPLYCNGCGRCAKVCAVDAVAVELIPDGEQAVRKARVAEDRCLGCGVCVGNCPQGAIRLEPRKKRVITPVNSAHRLVSMAVERGKLQNLIFDNQAHLSHRVMAAVLGAILNLPPVKRALANRQLNSRYLERICSEINIESLSRFD